MFRCTDCNKEYQTHPGYCECGNDNFEEILDAAEQYNDADGYADEEYYDEYADEGSYNDESYADDYNQDEYEQEYVAPAPKLKKNVPHKKKKKEPKLIDKIGLGVFIVCIILSILAFIFIGSGQKTATKKGGEPLRVKDYSIPANIDTIWNSTPPKAAPTASHADPSKILNTHLNSIDTEMNSYLIGLAQAMIESWVRDGITGNGSTQMEFIVSKEGKLVGKKIYKYSGNKTLDNSIGMLINSFSDYQIPPSSYKQEIIIIQFSSNNGTTKANYPRIKG